MANDNTITVDLVPGGILPRLHVNQYDYGFTLRVNLLKNGAEFTPTTGMTAKFEGTKADLHGFSYNQQILATLSYVNIALTEQVTACSGEVVCEIIFFSENGSRREGTGNFIIDVEPAGLRNDAIMSDTDIPVIHDLDAKLNEAISAADMARSYAVGTNGSVRPGDQTDNARYYYDQTRIIAQSINAGLRPQGAVASVPAIGTASTGYLYIITSAFKSNSDFRVGDGFYFPANTAIYKNSDGKWETFVDGVEGFDVNTSGMSNWTAVTAAINNELDNNKITANSTITTKDASGNILAVFRVKNSGYTTDFYAMNADATNGIMFNHLTFSSGSTGAYTTKGDGSVTALAYNALTRTVEVRY